MSQSISATVNMAGGQDVTLTTHCDGRRGSGSHLSLVVAGIMITFYDQLAAHTHSQAWLGETKFYAQLLKASADLVNPQPLAGPLALTVTARGTDDHLIVEAIPSRLALRIGWITWVCHDRAAYDTMAEAWTTVRDLADLTLPARYLQDPRPRVHR